MNRDYIDQHHIVARYLADQLSDAEREAFEAYYIEDPEMVREMEATARFKNALATLADRGELPGLIQAPPERRLWQWAALAATVAVLAVGVTYLARTPAPRPNMVAHVEALDIPVSRTVRVERMRGGVERSRDQPDVEFELPAVGTAVALQIAPDFEATPPMYRVSLRRESEIDGPALAELDRIAADDGLVTVYLDRSVLDRGDYRLTVAGAKDTDVADQRSDFRMRLR
ncbi:MAG TPA: hypothetical protein VGD45_28590 [Steroidobacter sp.]|uniref:hypothetical protein n=1 Tax=Steroidobacter sp. TaxID=1978227 RepID=UPI002ED7E684